MAYRHVCAVAFVALGLVAAGCGKGETGAAFDPPDTSESPPRDSNAPPGSADDSVPPSSDAPPRAEDAPPYSSDAPPGGGRLGALCEQLCARLQSMPNCEDGESIFGMDEVCEEGCDVPPEVIPCENELAGLFDCLLELGSFCSGQQTQAEGERCRDAVNAFSACSDAMVENPGENPGNQPSCTPQGGCECDDECLSCLCDAGTNTDDVLACTEFELCPATR